MAGRGVLVAAAAAERDAHHPPEHSKELNLHLPVVSRAFTIEIHKEGHRSL